MTGDRKSGAPASASGEINAEVLKLFATPVAIAQLPAGLALSRNLRRIILARMAQDPGTQHSNLGAKGRKHGEVGGGHSVPPHDLVHKICHDVGFLHGAHARL